MVTNNGLIRIFWPSDTPNTTDPGVLVGWKNSDLDLFVITVLQDVESRNVDSALRSGALYRHSPHPINHIFERCENAAPQVLGSVNPSDPPLAFDPAFLVAFTHPSSRFPRLHCPRESDVTVQIIVFDPPQPARMQYLSLTRIPLALEDDLGGMGKSAIPLDRIEAEEQHERRRKEVLVEKLRLHTVIKHPPTRKELALPTIINQINCSSELAALFQRNVGLVGARLKRTLSVSERVVESANNLWDYVLFGLWMWVYPVVARLFVFGLFAHRVAGELLLKLLEWRPMPDAAAIKDVSATAQQVDLRLQQFCYWPIQYLTLRKRKNDWESITNSHPEYIRFYNSLWLVANDMIMGIAIGSYVIENAGLVASHLDTVLTTWSIEGLRQGITWLTDWPGGLKLNTELAAFLGDLFLWVIDYWSGCMDALRPFLPGIINFIGFSSFAGATMPISLLSDLISVLTLHIYSFYVASARIYNWQLTIIISLFHLFRGKKRNVLRNRIDSCDYDLDQLLLGTILFTLLFFLLPTVFVFYLTFASARMAIISLKALLDTLLACLNHFPLFALMLRIKDSRRLPDTRPVLVAEHAGSAPTSHIILKSVPLPLRAMLNEYFRLGNRIRKHYLSPGVFLCLVTGRFVPPIHRKNLYSLQYSMLPARRAGVWELWARLTEQQPQQQQPVLSVANGHVRKGSANGGLRRGHHH